jgi:hypothetical protein
MAIKIQGVIMIYLDKNIFDTVPLLDNNSSVNNEYKLLGKDAKKQEKIVLKPTNRTFNYTFFANSLAKAHELRVFFNENFGRFGSFWLPSYKNDFEFIAYNSQNTNTFTAKTTARSYGIYNQKRHIYIPSLGYAAKITFVLEGDSIDTITLSSALPSGINSDTKIMYLFLCRLNSDEFTLENVDNTAFKVNLTFAELQGETP